MIGKDYFDDTGNAAQHKKDKITLEKTLTPVINPGNDGRETQSQHT
jgi:hypothetical protein